MCEEMSHLLRNIRSIICIFEKYAKDDGDCSTLSKGELKQLIQTEFADVIVEPYDPKTIETVLHLLDTDCDGKVGFEEFTVLVFKVVKACYKKVQECQGPAGGPSKRNNTSMQQQEIPPQQVSRQGPSQRDISRTQQREIPSQQASRQGPSQRDTTSMQQQEIPPQQVSRQGPSQRNTTSMQQWEIPPQQASKDGPSQQDISRTQKQEIPSQQVSRDGPSQQDTTTMQQREIPSQQASRDGSSQRDISRTQQREIPSQQVSRDGPSKRDITSIQQREIPSQQVSRDGSSQRDISRTQQREIPSQQVSRDGPSKRDITSIQQQEIPSQQVSRDEPSQRDTTSMQQREIPSQQASRDGSSQQDISRTQQREIPSQVSRDGPSKRDITSTQQREILPQQVSRDGPSQRDTTSMQQREIPPQQASRDGPSQRDNTGTQQWETQNPQVSPRPSQKLVPPKEVLDREELPQEQEREKTRLETSYDKQSQQEEASTHPATQTSRVQSVQKTIEDMIRGNLTGQTSWAEMRTEETSAQGALPPRRRCLQEPLSPDQEANQGVLQSAPQQSSQQRQVKEPSTTCQEEVTPQTSVQERRSQQSAVEMEQISAGEVTRVPSQETLQRSSGGRNQQVQVEERRSASSSHTRNPQVVQICDQESRSVTLGQRDDQKRSQSQGVEQRSVAQQDQEVQAPGQVISRRQEPQMPVYRPHQEKEKYPATLEQRQRGPSEQRATFQEVTRPQVAERYPRGEPGELTIVQFSQESSPRRPAQPSQFQLKQRPLQFPPPWSTKQ